MIHRNTSKTPFAIYCWFFQVVVVLGLASVVVWLSLIPKNPSFTISDFHFPNSNTTNSTAHRGNQFIANTSLIFALQISNCNKGMGVYYNDINITLYHTNATIGAKSIDIPGFYQSHKKSLICNLTVDANRQFWRGIESGIVDLRVCLETGVKYQIFRWKTKGRPMVFEGFVRIDRQGRVDGEKNVKLHHIRS